MRTKRLEIKSCGQCSYCIDCDGIPHCDQVGAVTTRTGGIPEWCPLPDSANNRVSLEEYADRVRREMATKSADYKCGFRSALNLVARLKV